LIEVSQIVPIAQPNETSFLSLENSGKLGIVRNQLLLKQLQEYRNSIAGLQKAQDVTFRPARGHAIELGHSYGLSIFGEMEDEAFIDLVAANPPLSAVLKTQLGFAKGHFTLLAAANEKAALLLEEIQREIVRNTGENSTP
jgi:hypothetical protein